jgi:flagellum-specific peptidoglycan hydrolase FlgJ
MQLTTFFSISLVTAIVLGKFTPAANPTPTTVHEINVKQSRVKSKTKSKTISPRSEKKLSDVEKYIERFKKTAIQEMKLHGIPASITLAQGIIESNSGRSTLSTKENNHFGIKCKSKCGCKCAIYADDKPNDRFRVFKSAWYSYREHSKLLNSPRYKHLHKLAKTDYRGWAKGLKKAGYATHPQYDKMLIKMIEIHDLHKYDKA